MPGKSGDRSGREGENVRDGFGCRPHGRNMSRKQQRRRQQETGQFWTPDWVAEAMVSWLPVDGGTAIVDPAVGAGAFSRAARLAVILRGGAGGDVSGGAATVSAPGGIGGVAPASAAVPPPALVPDGAAGGAAVSVCLSWKAAGPVSPEHGWSGAVEKLPLPWAALKAGGLADVTWRGMGDELG